MIDTKLPLILAQAAVNWRRRRRLLRTLLFLLCSVPKVYAEQTPNPPDKLAYGVDKAMVPDAIAKVRSGEFGGVHVDMIARAGAVEAIPDLKKQFTRSDDPTLKLKIAAALVRMKADDRDETYWKYLVQMAKPVVESDAPNFTSYDAQGKASPGPSPAFVAWADAHNLPHEGLLEESVYMQPGAVGMLGWSHDRRAVPYLRQGLTSPNYMIQILAAMGLAEIQDYDSIPHIIEACRKAPAEVSQAMAAESLVYFDDNSAQAAVDQYIPKDLAKIFRDAKANGKATPLSAPLYEQSAQ
jgi:HEAT repeats